MRQQTGLQPSVSARIRATWSRLTLLTKILLAAVTIAATTVAALTALIFLLPPVPQEPPENEAPAVKPVISDTQDRLDQTLIATKISHYIALTTWAELAYSDALEHQDTFYRSFMAEPDLGCAVGYQETRRLKPEASPELLFQCARQSMIPEPPAWQAMDPIEKEARARHKLQLLWKSIAPEYWLTTGLAFQNALEINRQNNDEFREFAEPYDVCLTTIEPHVRSLAIAPDNAGMSSAWITAARQMRNCSDRITEARFPLPPGSKNGPETTDDAQPPRPQPDADRTTGDEIREEHQVEGLPRNP